MPVTPTYPGVYIEEVSSGVRTITPVATAITAFVGAAPRYIANKPTRVQSFAEYERKFGGLNTSSSMSYSVRHFFQNGGSDALIIRVVAPDAIASQLAPGGLPLVVASPGKWGDKIRARVDLDVGERVKNPPPATFTDFNLFVYDHESRATEEFRNVSIDPDSRRFVNLVLEEESALVRVAGTQAPGTLPSAMSPIQPRSLWFDDVNAGGGFVQGQNGTEGSPLTEKEIRGEQNAKTGIYALEKADLFNILCLPPIKLADEISTDTYAEALVYCSQRRAMLLVDPPTSWTSIDNAENSLPGLLKSLGGESFTKNAAIFFPRLKMPDPLKENRMTAFVPCGAIAGVCARTDVARGVWKAPAGIAANLVGVQEFVVQMTDPENGRLNPIAVNCLRNFKAYGNVVWGSRTLAGADSLGSEWKYLPVRRFTLFLEESLYRGTQWVVFEPNDEPLWTQIRLNIGVFLHDLFRQGAFQGKTTREAYFVKCDNVTTTQSDINRGIVNIEVGFAPLKPAEFVIIKIQQIAGKLET